MFHFQKYTAKCYVNIDILCISICSFRVTSFFLVPNSQSRFPGMIQVISARAELQVGFNNQNREGGLQLG